MIAIHAFLALDKPVDAEVLIVEGWLFDYMLDAAAQEIKKGKYRMVVTTGFELELEKYSKHYGSKSTAEYCKTRLSYRGIDSSIIYAVPAPPVKNDHTFQSAAAIKSWLNQRKIESVNVFTGGPHGRKSLILFQKALGKDIKVGVISCKIKDYDSIYWWTSLRGAKATIRYIAGYIYALVK